MSDIAETEEQVIARHKKETRDLVATTTGMKKQASKSKRKEVMKKIQEMETNMKQRHAEELKNVKPTGNTKSGESDEDDDDDDEFSPEKLLAQLELENQEKEKEAAEQKQKSQQQKQPQQPKKKRNRQKEKLAKREEAMKKLQEEARLEADEQPDLREIELKNIEQLCQIAHLKQHDITPDGHCLFASISDQLKQRQGIEMSVQDLRTKAANHIRKDPDTFLPFLFDEQTMSLRDITSYTKELEETTMWGGDLEILALAKEFDSPIILV
ncbi:unnamed protein product [Ambrosiozyma monospora]|uniref:Unnamed protein product n=1 Tax=Ambrosiozyma monospora TaxID=43982 RepID=A0A9W6YS45_AMBMO|nr:unnamed protein product [Ambrosiozyma monospora]